ncbi:DUF2188 domain-containing protein [Methylobacterium organophilum]|uniref:DUF2188 domain-containing protein n=1 Tax=Methylobacterium organophilum TaxID=410 RepID=A0ABQ4T478_METOR|nr:DUF2188 domain-containing protein [Methylobacterium organophilum]UMY19220.1 DUF2188 domain-containing protein [Methylobacterium organophilum]GJE25309.1 hypothetical protein LKMONMHP_0144 [Methylobacterium organophilum]
MGEVVYHIIEHDGGYAYRVGDTISETFPSRAEALEAAQAAAAEQQVPGSTEGIRYQDGRGVEHEEVARGNDRPKAKVEG